MSLPFVNSVVTYQITIQMIKIAEMVTILAVCFDSVGWASELRRA